jgi:transcriptional regulator with XRE-family HTH domain
MDDEEVNLPASVAKLGRLNPILKDNQGIVFDGFHRQLIDPKWADEFSVRLENIKTPVDRILAKMAVNLVRRTVPREEKTQWLKELKQLTGWTPKQIAENSGMSERWVYKYLPSELKQLEPEVFVAAREEKKVAGERRAPLERLPQIEQQIIEAPAMKEISKDVPPMDIWIYHQLQDKGIPVELHQTVGVKYITPNITVNNPQMFIFIASSSPSLMDMENRELLAKQGRVIQLQYQSFYDDESRELLLSDIIAAIQETKKSN